MSNEFTPPFIDDQHWSILGPTDTPKKFLTKRHFRTGSVGDSVGSHEENPWRVLEPEDRWHIVQGDCLIDGKPVGSRLIALVSDAGVGKTRSADFFAAVMNSDFCGGLAISVRLDELAEQGTAGATNWLKQKLTKNLLAAFELKPNENELTRLIDRHLNRKRLMIVFDGLDQVGSAAVLKLVIDDAAWKNCRFVVAGRPNAIQREWTELFEREDWTFLRLEEFDEDQQRKFLGRLENGKLRFDQINEGARKILGVPRVLMYLAMTTEADLAGLKTAADILNSAVGKMIRDALGKSNDATTVNKTPASQTLRVADLRRLLSLIAYRMTLSKDPTEKKAPNFDRVPDQTTFANFCRQIKTQYTGDFDRDLKTLASLNTILEQGFFEAGETSTTDFTEFQFSNRTLQEFFCAEYMAQNVVSAEAETWWKWIFLANDETTNELYHVWQYLCDMPDGIVDINDRHESWLHAIRPLYRPGDGTAKGTKRSTEMIFRSWKRLDEYCHLHESDLAQKIRSEWLGEFQTILDGTERGTTKEIQNERKKAALELTESFLRLNGGTFKMGASKEHQRAVRSDWMESWDGWLKEAVALSAADRETRIDQSISSLGTPRTAIDRQFLKRRRTILRAALVVQDQPNGRGVDYLSEEWFPLDETPNSREQQIAEFAMSRMPTRNSWYRLFDPGHGFKDWCPDWMEESYEKVGSTPEHPVIYVSWFDAWAFALWAHWKGGSCRLPWENEWEYAAKYGLTEKQWDQRYWWGDTFDEQHYHLANVDKKVGRTNVPTPDHASDGTKSIDPLRQGLMDMLGNVWEFCQDVYRRKYERDERVFMEDSANNRVVRGGSWAYFGGNTRSSIRSRIAPVDRSYIFGFRLMRVSRTE